MSFIRAPPEWGIEPVPEELRKLRHFDIAVLWSSLGVGLLVMQAGALLVQWLNLSVIYSSSGWNNRRKVRRTHYG